jgi:hypothetical protein
MRSYLARQVEEKKEKETIEKKMHDE